MIEGAAHGRTVGIVDGLSFGIIDEEGCAIRVEATVAEHIIATVIDTAVQAAVAEHIGEHMVLAEVFLIDTGTAACNMTVGHRQGRATAVAGIFSVDTAAGKPGKEASTDDAVLILPPPVLTGRIPQESNAMPLSKRLRRLLRSAVKRDILDRAKRADPNDVSVLHILPQTELRSRAHSGEGTALRHLDPTDGVGSRSQLANVIFLQPLLDRFRSVSFHLG